MMTILPYLTFFFVFFLMANFDVCEINLNRKSRKLLYLLALALMILFAGFRWFDYPLNSEPGVWKIFDYSAYEHVYYNGPSLGNFIAEFASSDAYVKSMDIGFVYISSFFSHFIFSNANLFFLLISFVTVILFSKGLSRNHINYGIFVVLFIFLTRFYFQYNFIMMRQAIAMAIVWWAIPFVIERKFWSFFLLCAIGAIFHFTALLFVIVYILPKFNFSNKFLLILLPVLLALSIVGVTDKILLLFIVKGLSIIGLGDKVATYIGSDMYSKGINPLNFLEIAPFLYFAIKYRIAMCSTEYGRFFFNLFVLYVVFLLVFMNFMALTRISSYYLYSILFIVSFTIERMKLYSNRAIYRYLFMMYFFIYGVRFIYANFSVLGYRIFFLNQ